MKPPGKAKYEKDTLGYHRVMAVTLFGEDSPAVSFLDKKAAESPNGLNEPVIASESQVVLLLMNLHLSGSQ